MPRKRTRSGTLASLGLGVKSKKINKPKVAQTRVRRARLKRQLAFDEETETDQCKQLDTSTAEKQGEVTEHKDETRKPTLSQFRFERILSENPTSKSVAIFGRFPMDSKDKFTVILAEKMGFTREAIEKLFTVDNTFTHNFQNDIYGQYTCDAGIKLTVIYPATDKHVKKYSQQSSFMVQESSIAYATKIKPYAETQALSLQVYYHMINFINISLLLSNGIIIIRYYV